MPKTSSTIWPSYSRIDVWRINAAPPQGLDTDIPAGNVELVQESVIYLRFAPLVSSQYLRNAQETVDGVKLTACRLTSRGVSDGDVARQWRRLFWPTGLHNPRKLMEFFLHFKCNTDEPTVPCSSILCIYRKHYLKTQ